MRLRRLALILFCGLLIGCGNNAESVAQQLHRATVPPDGAASTLVMTREGNTIVGTWQVASPWSWVRYAEWARGEVASGFVATMESDEVLRFRKELPGDVYYLEIRATAEAPNQFTARFTASAF